MAVAQAGSIFIDADGAASDERTKVSGIIFTTTGQVTDEVTLRDGSDSLSPIKTILRGSTLEASKQYELSLRPLIFQTGIYVDGLSASCSVTILTTIAGAST